MKLISAFVKPFVVSDVCDALRKVGVSEVMVTDVKNIVCGGGAQHGIDRQPGQRLEYHMKARLELAVADALVDSVTEAIEATARTGRAADGRIFMLDLQGAVCIRSGRFGVNALM